MLPFGFGQFPSYQPHLMRLVSFFELCPITGQLYARNEYMYTPSPPPPIILRNIMHKTLHCMAWWVVDVCQVICRPCSRPPLCKSVCMRYEPDVCRILICSSTSKCCSFSKTSTDKGTCLGYALYAKWLAHEWTIIKPLARMPLDAGLALRAWHWEPSASAKSPALRASAESLGTTLSAESLALRAQCKVQH
jgi:hypothetical protein